MKIRKRTNQYVYMRGNETLDSFIHNEDEENHNINKVG